MPSKSAFPNPAAVLPGEADILAKVVANLADHTAKLVYADWLEERGDPRGPMLRGFVTAHQNGKKLPRVKSAPKPWRDLVGIGLLERLPALRLTEYADSLLGLARPALTFKAAKASEAKLAVGAGKFGGRPDMPPGAKWPTWRRSPLAFLGQFNLDDLQASPVCRELPESGILSVFYAASGEVFDNSDKGGWRVFHFPDASGLVRQDFPQSLGAGDRFKSCRLSFTETLTLPERDSPWGKELPPNNDETLPEPADAIFGESSLGPRILGYASSLQNDVHGRKNVRHLLTIDSDDGPGWMWGDVGLLYFTIREDDLRKQQFDRVRFEMQCC